MRPTFRILLVEDSRTAILLVKGLLEESHEDFALTTAGTLTEAIEHLYETNFDFDLILLDLTLPDSMGMQTVDRMVAASQSIPIVVLTSTADETFGLEALRHGAQDFLMKDETYRKVLLRSIKYAVQRSRAEQELREAKEMAEFMTRSKSSFIANLSHELRTPLNAIIGFSEMMMLGVFGDINDKYKEYAKDVNNAGRYLLGLIGTVLDISKIESNRLELQDREISFVELMEEVVREVQQSRAEATCAIHTDLKNAPARIIVDPVKFQQVLTNLLSNGVKFTDPDGRVDCRARVAGDGGMEIL